MKVRDLTTIDECRRVVELEKLVWGYTDAEDVVPIPILIVTVKRGGVLIGAFDDSETMVGFVYSLPGLKNGKPMQWSHMLGVLDGYRNSGLGHVLKLEQRTRTLAMGLDLIEWTFDPLQALNAHLNFRKLGIIVEEYEENIYGDSSSPLHRGSPTDRFVAQWLIASPHVAHLIAPARQPVVPVTRTSEPALINTTRRIGEWRSCESVDLTRAEPRLWVEIPTGFTELQAKDPNLARSWRFATREIFTTYFGRGYHAVDFTLDRENRRGRYLLVEQPETAA